MKNKVNLIKIVLIIITTAIVFYNLGISATLKNLEPHATANGYEITVFGETWFYTD
jgi:hypothetical protein